MTVSLDIFSSEARRRDLVRRIWWPFMDHVEKVYLELTQDSDEQDPDLYSDLQKSLLAEWNAHTDWHSDRDPIHFQDQESLVQFVLAWDRGSQDTR